MSTLLHGAASQAALPGSASARWSGSAPLTEVLRIVLEAALETEIAYHLRRHPTTPILGVARRPNVRNGSRPKKVHTAFGPVTVSVPRDRWGTFDPVAIGKWQRQVVGLDRLALPLAAKGANLSESAALLGHVFHPPADVRLADAVAAEISRRMVPWHERPLEDAYRTLVFDSVVVRSRDGTVVSSPVRDVVGVMADGRQQVLALQSVSADGDLGSWHRTVEDLRVRGIRSVEAVVCRPVPGLDILLRDTWPGLYQLS